MNYRVLTKAKYNLKQNILLLEWHYILQAERILFANSNLSIIERHT